MSFLSRTGGPKSESSLTPLLFHCSYIISYFLIIIFSQLNYHKLITNANKYIQSEKKISEEVGDQLWHFLFFFVKL